MDWKWRAEIPSAASVVLKQLNLVACSKRFWTFLIALWGGKLFTLCLFLQKIQVPFLYSGLRLISWFSVNSWTWCRHDLCSCQKPKVITVWLNTLWQMNNWMWFIAEVWLLKMAFILGSLFLQLPHCWTDPSSIYSLFALLLHSQKRLLPSSNCVVSDKADVNICCIKISTSH